MQLDSSNAMLLQAKGRHEAHHEHTKSEQERSNETVDTLQMALHKVSVADGRTRAYTNLENTLPTLPLPLASHLTPHTSHLAPRTSPPPPPPLTPVPASKVTQKFETAQEQLDELSAMKLDRDDVTALASKSTALAGEHALSGHPSSPLALALALALP